MLIGLQREHSMDPVKNEQPIPGGVRTSTLYAPAGGLSGLVGQQAGYWLVAAALAAVCLPLLISYTGEVLNDGDRGVTSELAFVTTFLLGAQALTHGIIEPLHRK